VNYERNKKGARFLKHSVHVISLMSQCCTMWLSTSLPNITRFSIFFHWHTLWTVGNKLIIKYPTTL